MHHLHLCADSYFARGDFQALAWETTGNRRLARGRRRVVGASVASLMNEDGGASSTTAAADKANNVSHAEKGAEWLNIHFARAGWTRRQLARTL